ncbi:MAG: hypothetical protein PHW00_05470, partial [Clostridia bacterium]|nr:hypothetical protein [Clostridia bacterium]
MNRLIAFVLGMLFAVISILGAVTGAIAFVYTQVTIEIIAGDAFDPDDNWGSIKSMTVEELQMLISDMLANPSIGTISYLQENYAFDLEAILDLDSIDEKLYDQIKDIGIFYLATGDINAFLDTVDVGLGLVFIKDYVSDGAMELLGDISIKDIIGGVGIGSPLRNALSQLKLGAFLVKTFDETYNPVTGSYTYTLKEGLEMTTLGLFANIPLGGFLTLFDNGFSLSNLLYQIKYGELAELGAVKFAEIFQTLGLPSGITNITDRVFSVKCIGDLIAYDETSDTYKFDPINIVRGTHIGDALGYYYDDATQLWYKDADMTQPVMSVLSAVSDIDVGAAIDSIIAGRYGEPFISIQVGHIMGMYYNQADQCWYQDAGFTSAPAQPLIALLASLNVGDTIGYIISNNLPAIIGGWKIGTLLNHYQDTTTGIWYSDSAMTKEIIPVLGALADVDLSQALEQLLAGNYNGAVTEVTQYAQLGELMNCYRADDGTWYVDSQETQELINVLAVFADRELTDLLLPLVNGANFWGFISYLLNGSPDTMDDNATLGRLLTDFVDVNASWFAPFASLEPYIILDKAINENLDAIMQYLFSNITIGTLIGSTTVPVLSAFADRQIYEIISNAIEGNFEYLLQYVFEDISIEQLVDGINGLDNLDSIPVLGALKDVMPYNDIIDVILNGNDDTMVNDILNNVLAGETISNLLGSELTNTVAG